MNNMNIRTISKLQEAIAWIKFISNCYINDMKFFVLSSRHVLMNRRSIYEKYLSDVESIELNKKKMDVYVDAIGRHTIYPVDTWTDDKTKTIVYAGNFEPQNALVDGPLPTRNDKEQSELIKTEHIFAGEDKNEDNLS